MAEKKTLREIDAQVAEKVMGWRLSEREDAYTGVREMHFQFPGEHPHRWHNLSRRPLSFAFLEMRCVIERLHELGFYCVTMSHYSGLAVVEIEGSDTLQCAAAEHSNPATALCLAALRAVGVDVEADRG